MAPPSRAWTSHVNYKSGSSDNVSYEEVGGNSLSSDSFASYPRSDSPNDFVRKDRRQETELVQNHDSSRSLPGSARMEAWKALVVVAAAFCAYFGPFAAVFSPGGFGLVAVLQFLLDVFFTVNFAVRLVASHRRWHSSDEASWPLARVYGWVPLSACEGPVPAIIGLSASQEVGYTVLVFFLRLLRISEFRRFEVLKRRLDYLCGLPMSAMEFAKCLFVTSLAAHWVACALCMLSQEGEGQDYWFAAVVGIKAGPCSGDDLHSDPLCFYSLALYWSIITLTGAGYHGDMAPQSLPEHRTCIICMFVMGYVWVFNAGKVFGLLLPQGNPERRGSNSSPAPRVNSRKQLQLEAQMSRLLEKNVELEAKIDRMLGELYAGQKLVRTE
mmetsp:Transcript_86789/g.201940  ORF Transcript_86789/g.201940 Transcript_86789/m.201940 type:complete len:384 (+) Transcript_86789:48-1199(+)